MDREIYYYLRTPDKKPVVTVCLLEIDHQRARGIAICSEKDNPCKRTGRRIAKTRAYYAFREDARHNCEIPIRGGEAKVLETVNTSPAFFNFQKARYNPEINHIEQQIMGIAI
jgi:hypothetical protein